MELDIIKSVDIFNLESTQSKRNEEEVTMSQGTEKVEVNLYKKICLKCTRLVGELGKKSYACSAKKGNTNCPAQYVTIKVGVDTQTYVDAFYTAIENNDPEALAQAIEEARKIEGLAESLLADLSNRVFTTEEECCGAEECSCGCSDEEDDEDPSPADSEAADEEVVEEDESADEDDEA